MSLFTAKNLFTYNPVNHFLFAPPPCSYSLKTPHELTFIKTADPSKYTCLYYLPCSKQSKTTIIYSHGNATDIGLSYDFLTDFKEECQVNIVHYEYYGYGQLKNFAPFEQGVYDCADAAYRYVLKSNPDTENIILMGTSLGCALTIHLACKYRDDPRLKGVILESPFTSVVRVVTNFFAGKLFDCFENIEKISSVQVPTFILHGRKDTVVPFAHGEELHGKVCPQYQYPPMWVDSADHNDLRKEIGRKDYYAEMNKFLWYCYNFDG